MEIKLSQADAARHLHMSHKLVQEQYQSEDNINGKLLFPDGMFQKKHDFTTLADLLFRPEGEESKLDRQIKSKIHEIP